VDRHKRCFFHDATGSFDEFVRINSFDFGRTVIARRKHAPTASLLVAVQKVLLIFERGSDVSRGGRLKWPRRVILRIAIMNVGASAIRIRLKTHDQQLNQA
jgi:hypothetical protein